MYIFLGFSGYFDVILCWYIKIFIQCRECDRGSSLIALDVHCNVYKHVQNYNPRCVFLYFFLGMLMSFSVNISGALYNRENSIAGVVLSYSTSICMYINMSRIIFYHVYFLRLFCLFWRSFLLTYQYLHKIERMRSQDLFHSTQRPL